MPLWMIVRKRDHPLRGQFACHKRLLCKGRVTMARVLTANQTLFGQPRTALDAPVIAIYGLTTKRRSSRSIASPLA